MANEPAFRVEKFPIGIASVGLGEIERRIPADEPPPLPPNAELSVIGKPVPRQNARGKVTGATRYTVDIALPGMLYGRILRSTFPHARIRALDLSAAARHPEVRAVLPLAQPGDAVTGVVRYVGAPIAAIAATSMAAAREAMALIRVDYQPLPFVVDMDAAKAPGAPIVHDEASAPDGHPSGWPSPPGLPIEGNVRGPAAANRGDAAHGFAASRSRRRGRIPHPHADPLLPGAARHRRRLARRRPDRLHVDAVHRRGARASSRRRSACRWKTCASSSTGWAAASARNRRSAVTAASRSRCRGTPGRRCASFSSGAKNKWTPATGRRPGSICASARAATAR